jgi:hypothetical protein
MRTYHDLFLFHIILIINSKNREIHGNKFCSKTASNFPTSWYETKSHQVPKEVTMRIHKKYEEEEEKEEGDIE